MGKGFRVLGVNKLNQQLAKNVTLKDLKDIVKMNGAELTNEAQRRVPVDTATLERSITQTIENNGLRSVTEPSTEYEAYVEFGTRFMAAQPFMQPSFRKQVIQFKKDLERLVK